MFGSVPLKTYLPDGDIDLAVFQGKGPKLRESWTSDLKNYLERETAKVNPQYRIRDVQIINAEVGHLSSTGHRVCSVLVMPGPHLWSVSCCVFCNAIPEHPSLGTMLRNSSMLTCHLPPCR